MPIREGANVICGRFAHEFCLEGNYYRAGDAVNFDRPGRHQVTSLQLARACRALERRHALCPRVAGDRQPEGDGALLVAFQPVGEVDAQEGGAEPLDQALTGTAKVGTWPGEFTASLPRPADPLQDRFRRGLTASRPPGGSASYTRDYVVVMMDQPGGTGSGTSGPAVRHIWEALPRRPRDGR